MELPTDDSKKFQLQLMILILHHLNDPRLWEYVYTAYYG